MDIGAIKAKIELDTQNFNQSVDKVKSQATQLESSFGKLNSSLQAVGLNSKQIEKINENIKKTNPEILTRQLTNVRQELKGLGVDSEEIEKIVREIRQASTQTEKFTEDVKKLAAAFAAGTVALGALATNAIKTAASFEQSMSRVKAITGATAEEFEQLRNQSIELGAATVFSASQAAEAQSYLAMAGFKTNEILAAMPGVLNLAAAGQIELARASDIASNILTGFQLSAEESSRVVDVMAKAMTNSNTNIEQLGYAMKYVAPVAASVGISIEETAAAIGKLSDAGIQGEMAGTQMRAMLLRLISPVGEAEKIIEKLGIRVQTASGKLKSFPAIIEEVSRAFEGLREVEKAEYASRLVGMEATSGFMALLSAGSEELRNYTATLRDAAGTADELADIQTDNLNGAIIEFESALESLNITIGDKFIPVVRQATEILTKAALDFKNLSPEAQNAILAFTGMTVASGALITSLYALRAAFVALKVSSPIILGLSAAIGVVSAAFAFLKTKQDEAAETARRNEERVNYLTKEYDRLSDALKVYEEGSDEAIRTSERMEAIMGELTEKAPDVVDAFNKQEGAIKSMTAATSAAITENIKLLQSQLAVLEADTRGVEEIGASGVAERSADIVNIRRQIDELKGQFWARADESIAEDWRQMGEIAKEKERIAQAMLESQEGSGYFPKEKEEKTKKKKEKTAEQIRQEMYRADMQYLEYKRGINQITEEQEAEFLDRLLKKYENDTAIRQQIEVRSYQLRKQMAEDAAKLAEKTAKEAFDHSVNWIEAEERRMIEAGATEEQITQMKFDAWSRVKNRYAEDTEFYKRADSEVFAHKQRLIEQATAMQIEALTKQRDMQREALAEMNRAAEEALRKQIADERAKTDSVTESIKRQTDAVRERYNAQIEGIRKEIAAIDEEIRKQNELDRIEDRRAKRAELQAKRDAVLADERFEKVVMGEDGKLTTIRTHDTAAIDEIDKQLRDLDIEEERERRRQALDERKRQLNDEISAINAKRDAEIAALQAEVEAVNKARDEKIAAMQTELEAMQETNRTKLEALDTYWADVLDKDKIAQDVRNEVLQEGLDVGLRKITSHLDAVMSEYQSKISAMIAMGESLSASLPMGGGIAGVSNTTNNSNSVNINSVNVTANNGNDFVNSLRRSYFS